MAIKISNSLEGPDDLTARGGGAASFAPNGGGRQAPLWGVDNPMVGAMSGLSQAVERFAEVQDDAAVSKAQIDMRAAYNERYLNPESGEFKTRRGASAQGMYDDGREFFSDLESNIKKDMTPRQQRMFTAVAANEMSGYARQIASHQGTEILNYYKQENQIQIQKAIDLAAADPMNPDTLPQAFGTLEGLYRTRATYEGWSDDYAALQLKEAQGSIVMGMATAVSAEKPMLGLGLLNENREFVDPVKYAAMKNTLENRVKVEQRRAEAERLATVVDDNAMSFVERLQGGNEDESKIQLDILALPKKERGPTWSLFNQYLNVYRQTEKRQSEEALGGIIDQMRDSTPGEAFKVIAALPEGTRLERQIKSGAKKVYGEMAHHAGMTGTTDPDAYAQLSDKLYSEEILSVKALRSDPLAVRVSRTDLEKLEKGYLEEYKNREKAAFEEKALEFNPKSTLKERSALFRKFEASISDGGTRDPAQRNKAMNEFWKTTTLTKGFFSFDKEVRGFELGKFTAEGYYPKSGPEYQALKQKLAVQGISPANDDGTYSNEQIRDAFQMMQGAK